MSSEQALAGPSEPRAATMIRSTTHTPPTSPQERPVRTLRRQTSHPALIRRWTATANEPVPPKTGSRARSTSTSIVLPTDLPEPRSGEPAQGIYVIPASPSQSISSTASSTDSTSSRVTPLYLDTPETRPSPIRRFVSTVQSYIPSLRSDSHTSSGSSTAESDYFQLRPTPSRRSSADSISSAFQEILEQRGLLGLEANRRDSLPTPALSHSLSNPIAARRRFYHRLSRRLVPSQKTTGVILNMGWTLGVLGLLCVVSLGVALFLLRSMPM